MSPGTAASRPLLTARHLAWAAIGVWGIVLSLAGLATEWWEARLIGEREGEQARLVERFAGQNRRRILELGAGFGGAAAAMADLGHTVVALDIDAFRVACAAQLTRSRGTLTVVRGDFRDVMLDGRFDIVCYFNGFGVGTDVEQESLLRRIGHEWLVAGGLLLLDVFSTCWWARQAGAVVRKNQWWVQQLNFDAVENRFVARSWREGAEHRIVTESARCYSSAEVTRLLESAGLEVTSIAWGGADVGRSAAQRGYECDSWKYLVSAQVVGKQQVQSEPDPA